MAALRGGSWKIFENLALNDQQSAKRCGVATLCRPNSKNRKTGLKLNWIEVLKNGKRGFDRSVDRSVELGFGFCFQQSGYGGWGPWLRNAGRGLRNRRNRRNRTRSGSKISPLISDRLCFSDHPITRSRAITRFPLVVNY